MRLNQVGNKGDHILVNATNLDTVTIPYGSPVCLKFTQTYSPLAAPVTDGIGVILPSTAGASGLALFYGVSMDSTNSMIVNATKDVQIFGLCPYALVNIMTRAASTNSWTSSASQPYLQMLSMDTINNCFLVNNTIANSNFLPYAILAQSISSQSASASATSDTRTAINVGVRVFLRGL